jgi:hypothetical protein
MTFNALLEPLALTVFVNKQLRLMRNVTDEKLNVSLERIVITPFVLNMDPCLLELI